MSVICKVSINAIKSFGSTSLVLTSCVAENEVMAAYNPSEEDKLFSQYSPSGSAEFVVPEFVAYQLPRSLQPNTNKLYLMFVQQDERPAFEKALCFAKARVASRTDFGGTSQQFDMNSYSTYNKQEAPIKQLEQFFHRIMIDNPRASEQFEPGQTNWWVGIYDASKFTMSEVIGDGHA